MEDEVISGDKTNNLDIFVPGEDIPLYCNHRTPFPPMIDYNEEEAKKPNSPVGKLRNILDNHKDYKEKILIAWRCKDNESFEFPQPERISAEDLYGLIENFVVRDISGLVRFHDTEKDLLRAVEEGL